VHLKSFLAAGETVPIGWVAVPSSSCRTSSPQCS
jgi:hypothetical protein